jgi:hypothetical protein
MNEELTSIHGVTKNEFANACKNLFHFQGWSFFMNTMLVHLFVLVHGVIKNQFASVYTTTSIITFFISKLGHLLLMQS